MLRVKGENVCLGASLNGDDGINMFDRWHSNDMPLMPTDAHGTMEFKTASEIEADRLQALKAAKEATNM